jgi:hypothetical protein
MPKRHPSDAFAKPSHPQDATPAKRQLFGHSAALSDPRACLTVSRHAPGVSLRPPIAETDGLAPTAGAAGDTGSHRRSYVQPVLHPILTCQPDFRMLQAMKARIEVDLNGRVPVPTEKRHFSSVSQFFEYHEHL